MAGYIGKAKSLAVLAEQDPSIPSQTGNSGKYLTTDGTDASWATVEALPDAIDVNASAPADSLNIDASGNVGIGTSPGTKLDVHNSSFGGSATTLHLSSTNSASEVIPYAGLGYVVDQGADGIEAGSLSFSTYSSSALTERMRIDSSGNLKFNSGYGSAATAYGCRAWVNFQGSGTVTIRASGNVSSIADNGVGQYTVNFTTAMPDANYCWSTDATDLNNGMGVPTAQSDPTRSITTSALPVIYNYSANQNFYDCTTYTVAVFR